MKPNSHRANVSDRLTDLVPKARLVQRVGAEKVRPSQVDGSTEVVDDGVQVDVLDSRLDFGLGSRDVPQQRIDDGDVAGFDEEDPVQRPMSGPAHNAVEHARQILQAFVGVFHVGDADEDAYRLLDVDRRVRRRRYGHAEEPGRGGQHREPRVAGHRRFVGTTNDSRLMD